jgi:Phage Tail Collar Domain
MSTFSPTIQLEEVARGGDVGTWDTPTNSNWGIVDSVVGLITTIGLNNTNVVLSAAQFQSKQITFNSTLTGNVIITFPTSFIKSYEIQNVCTGSSAFTVTLETTAGGQVICAPPGQTITVFNDGSNLKFSNLPPVGSFLDMPSNPLWNQGCTVPPYLDCNGQTISSGTYPALVAYLGGTTLPDFRGRFPAYLNEGTGRLTSGGAGLDGTTLFAAGGSNGITLSASQVPQVSASNVITVTTSNNASIAAADPGFSVSNQETFGAGASGQFFPIANGGVWHGYSSLAGTNTITVGSASPSNVAQAPPSAITGIRMIRGG